MESCYCGLIKQKKAGTRVDTDGVERCNNCDRATENYIARVEAARVAATLPKVVSSRMMTTLADLQGYRVVEMHGVVTELAATSGFTATSKGTAALEGAMADLGRRAAVRGANAVVGLHCSMFGAAGGITNAFGGDAVGVLLMGTAVTVEPAGLDQDSTPPAGLT